jgi:hypothetical protein
MKSYWLASASNGAALPDEIDVRMLYQTNAAKI